MTKAKSISGIAVNRKKDGAFLEGELGDLENIELVEDRVLTIKGSNGTLRIDISKDELMLALFPKKS